MALRCSKRRQPTTNPSLWYLVDNNFERTCNQNIAHTDDYLFSKKPCTMADSVAYGSLLRRCTVVKGLAEGKRIHVHIISREHEGNTFVGNLLVHLYGSCGCLKDAAFAFDRIHEHNKFSWNIIVGVYCGQGCLEEAQRIFDVIPCPDPVAWSTLIASYVQNDRAKDALELLHRLSLASMSPNKIVVMNVLDVCANHGNFAEAKWVQAILGFRLEADRVVSTALVKVYGKCGNVEDARQIFERISERDLISWNAMIAVYAQHEYGSEALQIFEQMQAEGVTPNGVTFISILAAFANFTYLAEGKRMHAEVIRSKVESDVILGTSLASMYCRCGSIKDARKMFESMPDVNVVSWTTIIVGYVEEGLRVEALQCFNRMQLEGILPDRITLMGILSICASHSDIGTGKWIHAYVVGIGFEMDTGMNNTFVNMYGKCDSVKYAELVFDGTKERDIVSWNAMITVYTQHGQCNEALLLYQEMWMIGVLPDRITFVTILDLFAEQAALDVGMEVHHHIINAGLESDTYVCNSLVNLYSKCGNFGHAQQIFDAMHRRDLVSWNVMIAAYSQHGDGKMALEYFQQMHQETILPDDITLLAVLSACSHAGLVDNGCLSFVSMTHDHNITPTVELYASSTDLLGRAGDLDAAEEFILSTALKASASSWLALLRVCVVHVDLLRAKRIAEHIFKLDPGNSAPYILLSNLYVASGKWDAVVQLRKVIEGIGHSSFDMEL